MAQLAAPRRQNLAQWAMALLGVALFFLATFATLGPAPWSGSPAVGVSDHAPARVAYFEFGFTSDTLWTLNPNDPASRQAWFSARHAPGFGLVPSLSLDGGSAVYTVLPPGTLAPSPDSPAQLWLVKLVEAAQPQLIGDNFDLLVAAVWSPDSESVVLRRSASKGTAAEFELLLVSLTNSTEDLVVSSPDAIFPVAFAPDGSRLYYVMLRPSGSFLFAADLTSGEQFLLARLSDGLTRDWALSPSGAQLAFLTLSSDGEQITSRAYVFDLASGARQPAGAFDADAFNPTWDPNGNLLLGQLAPTEAGSGIVSFLPTGNQPAFKSLSAPKAGFDVPLGQSPQGGWIALRSFEGRSAANPGRSVLAILDASGTRQLIATGEVTFLGWITP